MGILYFDNAATTKPDKEVIHDIAYYSSYYWGNPSSIHVYGENIKNLIEESRNKVAKFIDAEPNDIIFTSGGTESNNYAINSFFNDNFHNKVVITSKLEHPSVYKCYRYICCLNNNHSKEIQYVKNDRFGRIDLHDLKRLLDQFSKDGYDILVSIMFTNNEIGTYQDVKKISDLVHEYNNAIFHTDAVQAFGHTPINVKYLGIDLMSVSAHKFGGPKGVGFLYYNSKKMNLNPVLYGGNQEWGLRSGTENTAAIIAMANHIEHLDVSMTINVDEYHKREWLRRELIIRCNEIGQEISFNGPNSFRFVQYNILSVTLPGINASDLILLLSNRGVCVSAGSACSSGKNTPSRVLKAIGLSDNEALSTIRISTNNNKFEEYELLVKKIIECIQIYKNIFV